MQNDDLRARLLSFRKERDWEQFHNPKDLAISIVLEAAELLEVFQWSGKQTERPEKIRQIREELADILIYCFYLCHDLDLDIQKIIEEKIALNIRKYPAEKVRGSSRKYNEYEDSSTQDDEAERNIMNEQEVLEFIRKRRSTRHFRDEAVDRAKLERIVEAGRYAPSGGNSQQTRFLVLQNPQLLTDLSDLVQKEFAEMEIEPGMYRSIASSIAQSKKGGYDFRYGAPVLVLTASPIDYPNHASDCATALENMMLQAQAEELGSVWINQVRWLNDHPTIRKFLLDLGMKENEAVYGGLAIGYPAVGAGEPLERHGNPVEWID